MIIAATELVTIIVVQTIVRWRTTAIAIMRAVLIARLRIVPIAKSRIAQRIALIAGTLEDTAEAVLREA